jgi:hypothetical protein
MENRMIRKIFVLALALSLVAFAGVWAVDKSKMEPVGDAVVQDNPAAAVDGDFLLNYACNLFAFYPVPDALPAGALDTWEGNWFTAPSAGKLKSLRVTLANRTGAANTNDTVNNLRLSVFGNTICNGFNVPDSTNVLVDVTVPNATLLSGGWAAGVIKIFTVDVSSFNVNFNAGDQFHVMLMTAPGDTGNFWTIVDDGSCPNDSRWVEWGPGCPCPTAFHSVPDCFGAVNSNNIHIAATLSAPKVPSLTTYGLIGLTVLLLGTGVWMFRRKIAPANAPNLG